MEIDLAHGAVVGAHDGDRDRRRRRAAGVRLSSRTSKSPGFHARSGRCRSQSGATCCSTSGSIPTGATEPTEPLTGAIGGRTWDDGFDRIDPPGRFVVRGGGRSIAVDYAEGYPVAQVFAPPGTDYICIEPMTAPANALIGPDSALEWVPAGEHRSAVFGIEPS